MTKLLLPSFIFLSCSAYAQQQSNPWVAPESASRQQNPQEPTAKSISQGKKIFTAFCQSCHGSGGEGNGVAAAALKKKPANFRDSILHLQPDGILYWKISEGRGDMAPYKNSLTADQRWHLVNYIRSFKK